MIQTKPSSFVWKTAPFLHSGGVVLCPGLDTSQPGQVRVLGSGMGLSCDQSKTGTLLKLMGKRCSPSFGVTKLCGERTVKSGLLKSLPENKDEASQEAKKLRSGDLFL